MGGIRRGVALAAALPVGAVPAMAGEGSSNTSVRRQVNLAPVAAQAIVSGYDDSSAVLRLFRTWDAAATAPRAHGSRREGPRDARSLGEHREVPGT